MKNYDKAVLTAIIAEARSLECSYKEQKIITTAIILYIKGKRDLCLTLLIQKGFETLIAAWRQVAEKYAAQKEAKNENLF